MPAPSQANLPASPAALAFGTEVRMIKGVGPQRAEVLHQRGIHTLGDLLNYLPFRYENRIRFSEVKEVTPGNVYTLRVKVLSGQAVRGMRGVHAKMQHQSDERERDEVADRLAADPAVADEDVGGLIRGERIGWPRIRAALATGGR